MTAVMMAVAAGATMLEGTLGWKVMDINLINIQARQNKLKGGYRNVMMQNLQWEALIVRQHQR